MLESFIQVSTYEEANCLVGFCVDPFMDFGIHGKHVITFEKDTGARTVSIYWQTRGNKTNHAGKHGKQPECRSKWDNT